MDSQKKRYRSYLLRCWLTEEIEASDPSAWRVVVETVSDEPRRQGFNTFEELVAFLSTELLNQKWEGEV